MSLPPSQSQEACVLLCPFAHKWKLHKSRPCPFASRPLVARLPFSRSGFLSPTSLRAYHRSSFPLSLSWQCRAASRLVKNHWLPLRSVATSLLMTMIATGYIAAYARRNFVYSTLLEVALWSERGNIGYSFLTRSLTAHWMSEGFSEARPALSLSLCHPWMLEGGDYRFEIGTVKIRKCSPESYVIRLSASKRPALSLPPISFVESWCTVCAFGFVDAW